MRLHAGGLALAALVLALQGCGDEPTRTIVHAPPPDAAAPAAPAAAPAQLATPAAPAASAAADPAPVAQVAREPAAPNVLGAAAPMGDAEGAALLAQRTLVVPVAGVAPGALRDNFEQERGSRTHEAMDVMAATGTPVVAVDDGRIAKLFISKAGGLTVYHFDTQGRLAYYYAHLDRYAPGLRQGMAVKRGDVIGYVGATGNADPRAPHLHFAVFRLGPDRKWWEGEAVNPYPAFRNAAPAPG